MRCNLTNRAKTVKINIENLQGTKIAHRKVCWPIVSLSLFLQSVNLQHDDTDWALIWREKKGHCRPHILASVARRRPPTSNHRRHHTSLPDTPQLPSPHFSYQTSSHAFFTFVSRDSPSLAVRLHPIHRHHHLPSSSPRLSLSGDLCVKVDRDALYPSDLVPRENWCAMLSGMTDADAWKSSTWGGKEAVVSAGKRKHIETIDDAPFILEHILYLYVT